MMKVFSPAITGFTASALLALCATAGIAQDYPTKPVRLVVPFAPGGAIDTAARAIGQKLTETWKHPVLVENRPGAGGTVAADMVAKSPGDGHTMLIGSVTLAVAPSIYRSLPYDPLKDLIPVTQIVSSASVLMVGARVPAGSLKELVNLARAKPGSLNHGSTGIGSSGHLWIELLKLATGVQMVHVPYKGEAPMSAALIAGEVDLGMGPVSGAIPHIRAGKLRPLAMFGDRRSALIADVPTMSEAGVPGFESMTSWISIFSPAKVPQPVLSRFHQGIVQAIAFPDVKQFFEKLGYDVVGSTPMEFGERFRSDVANYAKAVKQAGIPLQ